MISSMPDASVLFLVLSTMHFPFYQVYKVKYCVFITYKYMNLRER